MSSPGEKPFTRADLEEGSTTPIQSRHFWARARHVQFSWQGSTWFVKDFRPRTWIIRQTIGRFLVRREFRALKALDGMRGVPQGVFRLDPFALCSRYLPGKELMQLKKERVRPGKEFFVALEAIVKEMHGRGVLHLDLRNGRNILVDTEGQPVLVDFQSSLKSARMPRWVRRALERVDLSGVYKWWARFSPESLDGPEAEELRKFNQARRLWPFKRVVFQVRLKRKLPRRLRKGNQRCS